MLGVLLAIAAAACWGASSIFARLGFSSSRSLNSVGGTFASMLASLGFVLPVALIFEREALLSVSAEAVLWFALIGMITFPFARYSHFKGVELIGASRASALSAASPLFAMVAAVAFLHEALTPFILTGILLIMAGLYSLSGHGDSSHRSEIATRELKRANLWGYIFSIFSALGWGGTAALTRWGVSNLAPPLIGVFIANTVGTLALSIPGIRNLHSTRDPSRHSIVFFLLAGLMSVLGAMANYAGLGVAPVVVVNPLANTTPLFTLLFVLIFLRKWEQITWRTILGIVVIIAGSTFITLGRFQ